MFSLLIAFTIPYLFRLRSYTLSNNSDCLPSSGLLADLGLKDKSIFFIPESQIAEKVEGKYSCAKVSKVIKVYPQNLKIVLEAVDLVVRIPDSNLAIDSQGKVAQIKTESKNLPTLDFAGLKEIKLGQKMDSKEIIFALKLAEFLKKTDYAVQSIRVVDAATIAAYARDDLVAIFSQDKEMLIQVDSLQQVLARTKIEQPKISKIDLRFDKPVVEYK